MNFWSLCAGTFSPAEIKSHSVGREDEIGQLMNALLRKRANVYLHGPRGIGKTFLLRMLEASCNERQDGTFTFFSPLDVQLSMTAMRVPNAAVFPTALAMSMISSAWRAIAGLGFAELANPDIAAKRIAFEDKRLPILRELYRSMIGGEIDTESETEASLGLNAVIRGDAKERVRRKIVSDESIPFQVHEHVRDLTSVLRGEFGITRVIALCDEANLLPVDWQEKIISNHLRVFSDLDIQFVFVAGLGPDQAVGDIPESFQEPMELKGLSKPATDLLVRRTLSLESFSINDLALEALYEYSQGSPRLALGTAWDAAERVAKSMDRNIGVEPMQHSIAKAKDRLAQYERRLSFQSRTDQ